MKFLQTAYEKVNSWLGNDPFEFLWNQKKYRRFSNLTPEGEHQFGQFKINVYSSNTFDLWFKDVPLLDRNCTDGYKYQWLCTGAFQQDFINFVDEYIARKTDERKVRADARKAAKLATLMLYVPGKVIF